MAKVTTGYGTLQGISDPAIQQAVRLLLDRLASAEGSVTALHATAAPTLKPIPASGNAKAAVDVSQQILSNLIDPVTNQDAATKAYVDRAVLQALTQAQAATTAAVATATGGGGTGGGGTPGPGGGPHPPAIRTDHRYFQGDLCGIRLPGLPYQPNSIVFTPQYPSYDSSWRQKIRAAYTAHKYTHFPLNIGGRPYADLYPAFDYYHNPTGFKPFLTELLGDGIQPVVFILPDNVSNVAATVESYAAPFFSMDPSVSALVSLWCVGWEINDWLAPDQITAACQWCRSVIPAGSRLYIHFSSEHGAGDSPEGDWWNSMVGVLNGIFYQDNRSANWIQNRLKDFLPRFGAGMNGWPIGMDTVMFEYDAHAAFWDNSPESYGVSVGNAAVATGGPVAVQGFCDGGTVT